LYYYATCLVSIYQRTLEKAVKMFSPRTFHRLARDSFIVKSGCKDKHYFYILQTLCENIFLKNQNMPCLPELFFIFWLEYLLLRQSLMHGFVLQTPGFTKTQCLLQICPWINHFLVCKKLLPNLHNCKSKIKK